MAYLLTGIAGFIGYHTARKLLNNDFSVVGIDNLNDYYDPDLKVARLKNLGFSSTDNWLTAEKENASFYKLDLSDYENIDRVIKRHGVTKIIHLAAQAGVRHSLRDPYLYVDSNITGALKLMEIGRHNNIEHFVYASSSSVYGLNKKQPLNESVGVNHPISVYAATKKANELMAHEYSHLFQLPTTGLRFFTAYGPWGRPDMALFKFTEAILNERPISLYNMGDMYRDFTYVDDIADGIISVLDKPPTSNPSWDNFENDPSRSSAPYRLYNIGRGSKIHLKEFVNLLEEKLSVKANINLLPLQDGDVVSTIADISKLNEDFKYNPKTSVKEGIANFVDWYREYYNV